MKIEVFFDDVITGQDDVITFRFSLAFKISGWTIAGNKNFWIWTILIVSGISQRTPTFQISSSKKCYKSMQNPSTKPCFRVSRLLWIRWWGQIWPIQTYNDTHFIYVSRHCRNLREQCTSQIQLYTLVFDWQGWIYGLVSTIHGPYYMGQEFMDTDKFRHPACEVMCFHLLVGESLKCFYNECN